MYFDVRFASIRLENRAFVAQMSVSPLKELFAQATNNTTTITNGIDDDTATITTTTVTAPPSAMRPPALTPRVSNLPPPSVFSKHTRSPFAPMTTPSPVPSSTTGSSVVADSASGGSTNSNLPTPTFRGTPPVTPFLTQRRGRCVIHTQRDSHFPP